MFTFICKKIKNKIFLYVKINYHITITHQLIILSIHTNKKELKKKIFSICIQLFIYDLKN